MFSKSLISDERKKSQVSILRKKGIAAAESEIATMKSYNIEKVK
jgi:hypothetical protein